MPSGDRLAMGRDRKSNPLLVSMRRRRARKGERYISDYEFPAHISGGIRKRLPNLDRSGRLQVERGLREWFICCAWRKGAVLGMPSRAVDEAWHEFILDSIAYTHFCQEAIGEYLHHTPDQAMATPLGDALAETVRAWDRSQTGQDGESILWDLDERLGLPQPIGLSGVQLAAARARTDSPTAGGTPCTGGAADGDGGGGGCGGGCGGGGA